MTKKAPKYTKNALYDSYTTIVLYGFSWKVKTRNYLWIKTFAIILCPQKSWIYPIKKDIYLKYIYFILSIVQIY